MPQTVVRSPWAGSDLLYVAYHDEQWGVPTHDDQTLFEMLILEGAQAGLSWITILKKRDNYRRAFSQFDPRRVARYDSRKVNRLLSDEGIVRNRLKIRSAIANAHDSHRPIGTSLRGMSWLETYPRQLEASTDWDCRAPRRAGFAAPRIAPSWRPPRWSTS